jgi:hypothetical protein
VPVVAVDPDAGVVLEPAAAAAVADSTCAFVNVKPPPADFDRHPTTLSSFSFGADVDGLRGVVVDCALSETAHPSVTTRPNTVSLFNISYASCQTISPVALHALYRLRTNEFTSR